MSDRDPARVGAFAARVLEDIYVTVHGEAPAGVRAWCDGATLLVVMRVPDADGGAEPEQTPGTVLYAAFARLLATAVAVRTGCSLTAGHVSVERELGLVLFVFRLPAEPRAGAAAPVHVPSWRAWTPVPSGGVPPAVR